MNIDMQLSVPQAEFLKREEDPLLIFQAGVGSGKTFIASVYLISHMLRGRRMVAGALTHGALMKTLFAQAFDLAWGWGLDPVINKQDKTLRVGDGITFGYSSEAPNDVLGLSNIYGLVLDEASRSNELFYNNLSDRLRGKGIAKPHKRLITSPCVEPSAEWYNELKRKHPEALIRAPLYTNPFVDPEYIHELEERYGIGTPLYRQQVLGEDIASDYLNAIVKDCDFNTNPALHALQVSPYYYGMDFATAGRDLTCAYVINDTGIVEEFTEAISDTQTHTEMVQRAYDKYRAIDAFGLDGSGGFSQGCYDNFKHKPYINVRQISFSESPVKPIYRNIRAEMYMELAQAIKDGFYIDREKYPKLVEELRNTRFFLDDRGLIRIIPKEDIKRIIGRSPDHSDALALAVYSKNHLKKETSAKVTAIKYLKAMGY